MISDTDASLRFYRDVLGLKVVGESENYGPEQERLNNVFGARLRITSLRAASGPGVEFLEYLAPGDGRPYPSGGEGQRPHPLANQVLGDQRGRSRDGAPESPVGVRIDRRRDNRHSHKNQSLCAIRMATPSRSPSSN